MVKTKEPNSYFEHSQIIIGRESEDNGYEIKITRSPGEEGWWISQGEDEDDKIWLPDDEAAETLALALTRLKEMAEGK